MKNLSNIKLNYLYRDASNYKNYGSVIFSNTNGIPIKQIELALRNTLIDGEYFIANKWNIPELFFEEYNSDDHEFHEFYSIEITNELETHFTIEELILNISLI